LEDIAQALFGMKQERLAGNGLALPFRRVEAAAGEVDRSVFAAPFVLGETIFEIAVGEQCEC
jgi:hypothetical protein